MIKNITKATYARKIFSLAELSSCHGIPNIIRTNSFIIRIIWTVAFLSSFSYSILSIVYMAIEYSNFEVVVNVELIQDFNMEFPAVTICNNNPIDFTHNGSIRTIESYFKNKKIDYFSFKNQSLSCNADLKKLLIGNFRNFGFNLDKMLLNCNYDDKECTKDDFYPVTSSNYGNCYTFNSGQTYNGSKIPIKKLKKSGSQNGLRLQLYVGAPEYQPCWLHENAAIVVVHNKSVPPLYIEEGVKIATGMESNLIIKKFDIKKLPYPYGECIEDVYSESSYESEFYKNAVKNFSVYTQKWCILDCAFELNFKNKNCSMYLSLECLEEFSSVSKYYATCAKECPIECNLSFFNILTNYARFPSSSYAKYLLSNERVLEKFPYKNPSMEQLIESVLSLNVYYDSSLYQRIKEEPKVTFTTLISNLGGQLGLFLGVSLLSFVEIIEIIIEIFFLCINR